MKPEFEEKTFETAANGELRLTSPDIYSPGQVAESILGFDVASFQPTSSQIWNYLQASAPGGIRLLPNLWPNGNLPALDVKLPSYVVSLVLQYKRADYLQRSNAQQFPHWNQPYYRFFVDNDQQTTLTTLEQALTTNAVVRYASPCFHLFTDLENFTRSSNTLANTNFVSPYALNGHEAWTYVTPGTTGWANPEGDEIETEKWSQVLGALATRRRAVTTVLEHLHDLASALLERGITRRVRLAEAPAAISTLADDDETRQGLEDLLSIGRVMARFNSNWWLQVRTQNP